MEAAEILKLIPHTEPFRFIDEILEIDENHIIGSYTFKKNEFFYQGHFPDQPVTPGVILTETAAQIGLVAFGIYLESQKKGAKIEASNIQQTEKLDQWGIAFTSVEMDYLRPVFPENQLLVHAEKIYFRFNKLKVKVKGYFPNGEVICKGELSGMFGRKSDSEKLINR